MKLLIDMNLSPEWASVLESNGWEAVHCHLAEALELIIGKLRLLESDDLSQSEKDTLRVFLGDVSAVRKIKASSS
jgi:hypothetical protein